MPAPDRIIRLNTVLSRTGLSKSTVYRTIADGTFPAQLKISTNGPGWKESDIKNGLKTPSRGVPPMTTREAAEREP